MTTGNVNSFSHTYLFGTLLSVDRNECLCQRFSTIFLVTTKPKLTSAADCSEWSRSACKAHTSLPSSHDLPRQTTRPRTSQQSIGSGLDWYLTDVCHGGQVDRVYIVQTFSWSISRLCSLCLQTTLTERSPRWSISA